MLGNFKPGNKQVKAAKRGEALNDDQKEKATQKRNNTFIILAVILGGLNYYKLDGLEKKQTTVIVPYGSQTSDMMITGANGNAEYITSLLRLIISDYGSVSKSTIDAKFANLQSMIFPERTEEMRKKLAKRMDYFKSFNTVSEVRELMNEIPRVITENPEKLDYETSAPKVYRISFTANVRKIIGDQLGPDKPEKMHVDYVINEGRFWILDIK